MGSEWHFRWKGQDKGPVSFQQLAQLVRSERLSEEDTVRRADSTEWVRVRDVSGLLYIAGLEEAELETEAASPPVADPSPRSSVPPPKTKPLPRRFPRIGRRRILVGTGVGVAVLLVCLMIWRHNAKPLFPRRPGADRTDAETSRQKVLAAAAAARSKSLSVPGLEAGAPQRVRGLEAFNPTSSFSLTEDLCTIVFAAIGPSTGSSDLWIANRGEVAGPFTKPTPIMSCNSTRFEGKPNISPDGLEMLFMSGQKESKWLHTKRSSPSKDFGDPEPWILTGLPDTAGQIACTRFLDATHVLVSLESEKAEPRYSFFIVERLSTKNGFGPAKEIDLAGCGAWACVRPDRLLAYFGTEKGLFVQGRDNLNKRFSQGHCIVDPGVCGPVQGAIWVALGDDVAFYRSPGPAKGPTEEICIWMIRF